MADNPNGSGQEAKRRRTGARRRRGSIRSLLSMREASQKRRAVRAQGVEGHGSRPGGRALGLSAAAAESASGQVQALVALRAVR